MNLSLQEVKANSQLVFWRSVWSSTPLSQRLWTLTSSAHRSGQWSLFISVCYPSVYSSASLFINSAAVSSQWINATQLIFFRAGKAHWYKGNTVRATLWALYLVIDVTVFLIQQSLEKQRTAEKERLFLVYAKQWWREFLEIRPSHQSKMVKIFAQVRLSLWEKMTQFHYIGYFS